MVVAGVTGLARGAAPVRRRTDTAGFTVAADRPEVAEGAMAVTGALPLTSLLAMQEAGWEAVQDREARRHGEALLDALRGLQRALLGGDGEALGELERLLGRTVVAADPALAGIVSALRVRAAVELARARRG